MSKKVLQELAEKARDRAEQWTPQFVRKLPDVETLDEMVMLGAHSFSLPVTRRRIIKDTITLEAGTLETPSAAARDYIRLVYKRGPRGTGGQNERIKGIQPVPCYAKPSEFLHGFYVDIKSCYWSIMQIAGWNVDYNPGLWLSPGRPPFDWPFPDHKVARNCLVSAGRMATIPYYDPKKRPGDPYGEFIKGNPIKNMQLPRLIHDVLNCIAIDALSLGAVYINNDGFIAPNSTVADNIISLITDWGLTGRIKAEGPGEVKAAGTYQIGKERTLNFTRVPEPRPIKNIYPPPYKGWLQKQFGYFAGTKSQP